MEHKNIRRYISIIIILLIIIIPVPISAQNLMFSGKTDIGKISLPGSFEFNPETKSFRVTGSGENIWGSQDAFYFLWNKVEGDLILTADISFEGEGKNAHRKAGWMIRESLEPDAAYVDAVLHGDGLISMQYRKALGQATSEVQSKLRGPALLRLEKTGSQYSLYVIDRDSKVHHPAGTISVELKEKFYTGLAVCSHDSTVKETAIFNNLSIINPGNASMENKVVESTLETMDIETGIRTVIYQAKEHFEAPNWSRDGKYFIINKSGKLYTIPVEGGSLKLLNTGFADKCNNDHGISTDGKSLVISHHSEDNKSRIYVLPIEGGEPELVTPLGPSYWHGWSPDGKTLVYCAERNGEYDVYSIPIEGGEETRLTTSPGLDDGPEYSPDGKFIYFNSVRTGQMKIWRMRADGSEQVQFSPDDDYGDWFAHPSPDNKWIVFVSYDKSVEGHPANKDVVLRLMSVSGDSIKTIAQLFGGQGTINVHSWSPDSRKFAFVSYRLVAP